MIERKVLRKPLAPIDDDAACSAAYERLLEEYSPLHEAGVLEQSEDYEMLNEMIRDRAKKHGNLLLTVEEFNSRVEKYEESRIQFVRFFSAHLETVDMVRANVERYKAEEKAASAAWESNRELPDKEPQTETEKEELKSAWQKEKELLHAFVMAKDRLSSEITKYPEVENENSLSGQFKEVQDKLRNLAGQKTPMAEN